MDFFAQQKEARRRSVLFVVLFIALIVALECAIGWFTWRMTWPTGAHVPPEQLQKGNIFAVVTVMGLSLLVLLVGTFYRASALKEGGGFSLALDMGGESLPDSHELRDLNLAFQRLRNVTEEMAIAARIPMPGLFWLPKEDAINAFVAGFTASDAVLAVTRGALLQLNRDELQGVVAHEFSHLLNGDMRLNTRVSSWLFGLYSFHILGKRLFMGMRYVDDIRVLLVMLLGGVLLMTVGLVGSFFGHILQVAMVRQREYLADAQAVQLLRQTQGLSGALEKVYYGSSLLNSPMASTYNHFFFGEGTAGWQVLASHPPLLNRIQRLNPCFNPSFSARRRASQQRRAGVPEKPRRPEVPVSAVVPAVLQAANAPLEEMENRATNLNEADGVAFILANVVHLYHGQINPEERQIILAEEWGTKVLARCELVAKELLLARISVRLSRLRIMLACLHSLAAEQRQRIRKTVKALILADRQISLLEVLIGMLVRQYLDEMEHPGTVRIAGRRDWNLCQEAVTFLIDFIRENPNLSASELVLDKLDQDQSAARTQQMQSVLTQLNELSLDNKKRLFQTLLNALSGCPSPDQEEVLAALAIFLHAPPPSQMTEHVGNKYSLACGGEPYV